MTLLHATLVMESNPVLSVLRVYAAVTGVTAKEGKTCERSP